MWAMNRVQIGASLREARLARGLTVREAAEKAGLSYQLVSKVENGGNTTLDTLQMLAAAVGARADVVVAMENEAEVARLPAERRELALRFLRVLPRLSLDDFDLLLAEMVVFERRASQETK